MEVEELTANEAEPACWSNGCGPGPLREGLEPIGRAGEETTFDRSRHKPIGGGLRDGVAGLRRTPGIYLARAR